MKGNGRAERIVDVDAAQAACAGSDEETTHEDCTVSAMAMIELAAAQTETAMHHVGSLIEDAFADVDADTERLAQAAPHDWHAQAKFHLQMGFMLARRAVEMPTQF